MSRTPAHSALGEFLKEKTTIRYLGFRSANDGGRIFDFSISSTEQANFLASVEIPSELFAGENRIRLQEGVGIAYAKLKHLFDVGTLTEVPRLLSLTASDLAQYREAFPTESKRRSGFEPARPEWKVFGDRQTS